MKNAIFLAIAATGFVVSPAFAGGSFLTGFGGGLDSEQSSSGGTIYGGASIGKASDNNCDSIKDQASALVGAMGNFDCPSSNAWKLFGGYKITPNIAVEGSYVDFGKAENKFVIPGGIPGNAVANPARINSKATAIGVAGVASAPLTDSFNLFGKAGFAAWEAEKAGVIENVTIRNVKQDVKTNTKTDGVDLSLGAGAEYKINDNFGIRGEYEHFNGLNANMYSIGATFSTF